MSFKIENGIPIPEPKNRKKWHWDRMEVGQSVLVGGEPGDGTPKSILRTARNYGVIWDRKFRGELQPDGRIRIWRVK